MKKYLQKFDIAGLILLIAAVIWYFVSNIWSAGNLALAITGGVLVLIGLTANYRQIIAALGKRSSKYAGNYVVSLVLVLVIVCGLNYVATRHVKRFDMTGSGRYSLASQTIQVLSNLDKEVQIMAFFPGGAHGPLREMLTEYSALSGRLRYEFVDPDKQNYLARQYEVSSYGAFRNPLTGADVRYGTVIVSLGDRQERIEKGPGDEIQEEDVTNAIIKVRRTETKKVYFLQGHGEKNPDNSDQAGYSLAKKALEAQGYVVEPVNIAERGMIPEDADVLVIAGFQNEPFPMEMEFIETFLDAGGGALFMMDPFPSPALSDFFLKWGVIVDNNIVLDVSGAGRLMGVSESMPLVLRYENHPITDRFSSMSFFPLTRSIRPADELPEDIDVLTLFYSNENSWGETDLGSSTAAFEPGKDLEGPLSLAVAVSNRTREAPDENPAPAARMVVTGTSNFAIDTYFPVQGNGNLFLNMISWLAQDEDLISIRPKPVDDRRVILSQGQMTLVRIFTLYLLPAAAAAIGIAVVMRRRRM
ncbi:MAG: GldG family protein [Acidobacteriota bacterium]|nr:GldG family protein [Acidobacteriota bacterium]